MKYFTKISLLFIFFIVGCQGDDSTSEMDPPDDASGAEFNIATRIPNNITQIKASCGGTLTGMEINDVSEIGIVYGLNSNPTTGDHKVLSNENALDFTVSLVGLNVDTSYYVRSYVIIENEIFYGNEVIFSTLAHNSFDAAPLLTSQAEIDAFFANGFTQIAGFIIQEDVPGDITDLSALSTLLEINSSVNAPFGIRIIGNEALTSLTGLENLQVIKGGLTIGENNVSSLSVFNQVEAFEGSLSISREPILTSLGELSNLQHLSGDLYIVNNPGLQNLSGLENIISVEGNLYIVDNTSLVDFCDIENIIYNGFSGEYSVFLNAYNPTLEDLQAGNCSL